MTEECSTFNKKKKPVRDEDDDCIGQDNCGNSPCFLVMDSHCTHKAKPITDKLRQYVASYFYFSSFFIIF